MLLQLFEFFQIIFEKYIDQKKRNPTLGNAIASKKNKVF